MIASQRRSCHRTRTPQRSAFFAAGTGSRNNPVRVLASQSLNHFLRQKGRPLRLGEADLTFTCTRCGRSITADQADLQRNTAHVVYRCPHDGEELGTVSRGKFGRGGGDIELPGELSIRVGAETLQFHEFMAEVMGS